MMELVAAILGGEVGLDIDQIADAIWLSQFLTSREREPREQASAQDGTHGEVGQPHGAQAARPSELDLETGDVGPAHKPPTIDIKRAPAASMLATGATRFRSPAASALTQRLELARALRPLAWRSPRTGAWRVVEDVTAERIARSRLWLAELEPETEPALDLVIVIDTSPRLHIWQRITRELIDVLRSSSAFRTTTVWQLAGDQPDVVLRSAGGATRVGERSLIEAAHRTAMLVISDFADLRWRSAAGLACLRLWCRHMMVALVSLVPQRSWGRTLLGMLPATRLTSARRAIPSAALASEAAVLADAIPVPVISIDPASFGTWARLLAGGAHARARGVLLLPDIGVEARARYAASAIRGARGSPDAVVAEVAAAIRAGEKLDAPRDARQRVERFRRTHRPEVVELAAALISAPLELSVMLVVQRAVAPRTGTLELAEIIDSGLFEIEPPRPGDDEVRFRIAGDVRDHLSPHASIGDHLRVLEAVGVYLRDHMGSSIDFEAMVVDPMRPVGPVAGKDRRFAQMFVAELRRLGIDTAALDAPPLLPPAARGLDPLATVDRAMHRQMLAQMFALPRRLLVMLVHGEVGQGHDHFAAIITWYMRVMESPCREITVTWPPPSESPGVRLCQLLEQLARCLGVKLTPPFEDPTTPNGAGAWASALAPVAAALNAMRERLLVRHVLHFLRTGPGGDDALIDAYLHMIWVGTATRTGARIVVVFDARRTERSGLPLTRAWRIARHELAATRAIEDVFDRHHRAHGACFALPELTSIPVDELVDWLRAHGGLELTRDAAYAKANQLVSSTRGGRFDLIVQRLAALNMTG